MADKRTGNFTAGDEHAAQTDPFAELTQVIGFEPRQGESTGADAAIDLERELMRELDSVDAAEATAMKDFASLSMDLESALRATEEQGAAEALPVIQLSRPGAAAPSVEGPVVDDLDSLSDDVEASELENEFNALLGNRSTYTADEPAAVEFQAAPVEDGRTFEEAHPIRFEAVNEDHEVEFSTAETSMSAAPSHVSAEPEPATDDPFAMLAAMAEKYKLSAPADTSWRTEIPETIAPAAAAAAVVAAPRVATAPMAAASTVRPTARAVGPAPEIETVDVAERASVVADDLDIPEFEPVEEPQARAAFDDIDAEFNSLLNQMSAPEPVRATPQLAYATARSAAAAAPYATAPAEQDIRIDLSEEELAGSFDESDRVFENANRPAGQSFDYDDGFDDDLPLAGYDEPLQEQKPRRGLLIAAIVGGIAVLGVAGAVAMSMMGSAQGGAPALVKSDHSPLKVRPATAGGTSIPNQNSGVYETVANGSQAKVPSQEKLVTTAEDPIELADELPINGDEDIAAVDEPKGEDRIEQIVQDAEDNPETIAVAPRKVRTMVVKPDGSLVPAEAPAQPETALEPTAAAKPVEPVAKKPGVPAKPQTAATPAQTAAEPTPDNVAKDQTTASIEPQAQPSGAWTMQIASEGSEAAAQAAYKKLLARHGKLLDGKGVNIVKAEIEGKGTRWRVRIPIETRGEAAGLCSKYKSAGGSCFVSKS